MSKKPELNGWIALIAHPWIGVPICAGIAIYFDINLWLVLITYLVLVVLWIKNHNAAERRWHEKNDNI